MKAYYYDGKCVVCDSRNKQNKVFVFGSNLAGVHGAGAAKHAMDHHGAIWNVSMGFCDPTLQSYAIPTKSSSLHALALAKIEEYIKIFLSVAAGMPEKEFIITRLGCGLSGYSDDQIAPYFNKTKLTNLWLPDAWVGLTPVIE